MSTLNIEGGLPVIGVIRLLADYPVNSLITIKIGQVKYSGRVGHIIPNICETMNLYSLTDHVVEVEYNANI